MLVKVSQTDTPSARNLPATREQSYILDSNCETESCRPCESCDDLLSSGMFVSNQVVLDSSLATPLNISREYVSMSELEPNASRFFSPTNKNILGSSAEVSSNKRRRISGVIGGSCDVEPSNSGKENEVSSQSSNTVSSAPRYHQEEPDSRSPNEIQSNAEKLANEASTPGAIDASY